MAGINADFINPFINGAINAFQTMAQVTKVTRKDMYIKGDRDVPGDVSGVMGLSGAATGSVAITLPHDLAKKLVANMLMMKPEDLSEEDMHDGVGEIINMISGGAKSELRGGNYEFNISLPSIVSGSGHTISNKSGTPCIVIVLSADGEEFYLQVSLAPSE